MKIRKRDIAASVLPRPQIILKSSIYSFFLFSLWCSYQLYGAITTKHEYSILLEERTAEYQKQAPLQKNALKFILSARDATEKWGYPEIDLVYTWVNGSDPNWLADKQRYHPQFLHDLTGRVHTTKHDMELDAKYANGDSRFTNHDELRYSLRSVEKFAPWARYIHIVVADGQVPQWLNTLHPKIRVVPHSAIFRKRENLPTFNSNAIESHLSNIPDLADYYLYFNDDVFLGNVVDPGDFLVSKLAGQQILYDEGWPIKQSCSEGCYHSDLQNGICDSSCNVASCNWDVGDCGGKQRLINEKAKLRSQFGKKTFDVDNSYPIHWTQTIYTDGVLNREFRLRKRPRNAIPHMPHFFNKKMVLDMQDRLRPEFDWNDSHRFRHPEDMANTFAYMYYLNSVKVYAPTEKQAWRAAFDTIDSSWTKIFLFGTNRALDPVEYARQKKIMESKEYTIIKECTEAMNNSMISHQVDADKCSRTMKTLIQTLRLPFDKDRLGNFQDVAAFVIMGDDNESNRADFADVLAKRKKFITINDDTKEHQPKTNDDLRSMYLSFFPEPSAYEL